METYLQPWKKYAQFSGRASRREYWTFTLVNTAVYLGFVIVSVIAGGPHQSGDINPIQGIIGLAQFGFSLAALIPGLAVAVRRVHDINRSGWWVLLGFVCGIVLLIFALQEGDMGPNEYGPDPYDEEGSNPWNAAPPPPGAYTDLSA